MATFDTTAQTCWGMVEVARHWATATATRARVVQTLRQADIEPNGPRPSDPVIRDPRFFQAVMTEGMRGLRKAFMQGWWDCEDIDTLFEKVDRADLRAARPRVPAYAPQLAAA